MGQHALLDSVGAAALLIDSVGAAAPSLAQPSLTMLVLSQMLPTGREWFYFLFSRQCRLPFESSSRFARVKLTL